VNYVPKLIFLCAIQSLKKFQNITQTYKESFKHSGVLEVHKTERKCFLVHTLPHAKYQNEAQLKLALHNFTWHQGETGLPKPTSWWMVMVKMMNTSLN